jgi:hypothetical protein
MIFSPGAPRPRNLPHHKSSLIRCCLATQVDIAVGYSHVWEFWITAEALADTAPGTYNSEGHG